MPQQKRSVIIFPEPSGQDGIDSFRKKHDPLWGKIGPHITLIFPFESYLSMEMIDSHIKNCIANLSAFAISFDRISVSVDGWIWLEIDRGREHITALHDRLYSGIFKKLLRADIPYIPHLTTGRYETKSDAEQAVLEDWHGKLPLSAKVSSVIIEEIFPDESSHLINKYRLL